MIQQLLVAIILAITRTRSTPVSFGCYLQTNSYDVTITTSLPASSFAVPLTRTRSNTVYSYAISFKQLQIQKSYTLGYNGRYSILLSVVKTTATSMQIMAVTLINPNPIMKLQIVYLVVDSSFPYIQIWHYSYTNSSGTEYNRDLSITDIVNLSFSMNSSDTIVPVFSGLDLQQNTTTNNLGIYTYYQYTSSYQITLTFNINHDHTNLAFTITMDLIVYHVSSFGSQYSSATFDTGKTKSDNPWYNNNHNYYSKQNLNSSIFFYGIMYYEITSTYSNHIQFTFSNATNNANIFLKGNNQDVTIVYIYFMADVQCTNNSIWDDTTCTCSPCPASLIANSNNNTCLPCNSTFVMCTACNATACTACSPPYQLATNGSCEANCTYLPLCALCTSNATDPTSILCTKCSTGYQFSPAGACVAICGDGIIVYLAEECDDNNTANDDGCSSACTVRYGFTCSNTSNTSSNCSLASLTLGPVCTVKTDAANQFTLTLQLTPSSRKVYSNTNWNDAFLLQQPRLQAMQTTYDPSSGRLRILFSYSGDLQDQNINVVVNLTALNITSALPPVTLALPAATQNNQALLLFTDATYSLAAATRTLALVVSVMTLLLFAVGYFGAKLVALETAAVVQLSALLLFSLKNMSPAFASLEQLSLSLGVTILSAQNYFFQYSSLPPQIKTLLYDRSAVASLNLALLLIGGPLLAAAAIKILAVTKFKQGHLVDRAWKNCLGTFTLYGLLFMAYTQCASFAVDLRYPSAEAAEGLGIVMGVLFITAVVVSLVLSNKYPKHYGSFKNKFYKFSNAEHFYCFSAAQRLLTPFLLICVETHFAAMAVVGVILVTEAIAIMKMKPYMYTWWQRPACTKFIAAAICLIYIGASLLPANHTLNSYLALLVLILLILLLLYSFVRAAIDIREYWKQVKQKIGETNKQVEKIMTVDESMNLIFKQFQKKMMPEGNAIDSATWRPVQHEKVDIENWRWQQYAKLYSLEYYRSLKKHPKQLEQTAPEPEAAARLQAIQDKAQSPPKQRKNLFNQTHQLYDQI